MTPVGFSMGGGEGARFLTKQGKGRVSKAVLVSSVVSYMLKSDDNPDGVSQSKFDTMKEGMAEDGEHFFKGFFKDFFGTAVIAHPSRQRRSRNECRQTIMAGL